MTMPNFIVIGGAKSGTTALHRYLAQHPDIYVTPTKEPQFFALEGREIDFQGPSMSTLDPSFKHTMVTTLEEYRALFDGVSGEKAIGDVSTWYLYFQQSAERIRHYVPDAKLIAILRDPAERAFSGYLHAVQARLETINDFAKALEAEGERIRENWWPFFHYRSRGYYYPQLKRYYDLFPREQVLVYLYRDYIKEPAHFLQTMFRNLGVDDSFAPDMSTKHNVTSVPKSRKLRSLIEGENPVKAVLKPLIPAGLRKRIVSKAEQVNRARPKLDPEMRRKLIEDYREDILKTQELTGLDLSHWLKER